MSEATMQNGAKQLIELQCQKQSSKTKNCLPEPYPRPHTFLGRTHSLLPMRRTPAVLVFMVVWLIVTTAALTLGLSYNWPDNVHTDYGLPLTWATNTTSTIAGPANLWNVNMLILLVDLTFWLGIMITAVTTMLYKLKP